MNKIRLLHCSDFHFGAHFSGLPATKANQRKEDLLKIFEDIIDTAFKEKVQILLIAGDLFEHERAGKNDVQRIANMLSKIPETKVFISPGDHDPYVQDSPYRLIEWPLNVHVFSGEMERIELPEWNVVIYGRGFSSFQEPHSLLDGFRAESPSSINIMVLHGEVLSEGKNRLNPLTSNQIAQSGLDYLALGHHHSFSGIEKAENTYWAYSGSPEGKDFSETGSKGLLIGEAAKGFVDLSFREVCRRQFFEEKINLSEFAAYDDVVFRLLSAVPEPQNKHLFRIRLSGTPQNGLEIQTEEIKQNIQDKFFHIEFLDETEGADDVFLSDNLSLQGIFMGKIRQKIEEAEDEEEKRDWELALQIGLTVLNQGRGL